MNRHTLLIIIVAGIAGLAGGLAAALLLEPGAPAELAAGTRLSEPRPLPEFRMTRHDGTAFDRDSFRDRWSLVFFGFTHCPDVCPNTLFVLDRTVEQLAGQNLVPPDVVFVSVDPARDTPEKMAGYVQYFNPDFVGITGDDGNLEKLTQAMSVAYERRPDGDDYTVIHSSAVLLVDPQARLHAIFTPPLKADAIAADLSRLISD
ncbi:MAG TPA: SCO family protein [Gammaproteobacteria bacterium]